MIATSKAPVAFTLPWRKGPGASVFQVRPGDVIERAELEAEIAGEHRAARVYRFELDAAFEAGVKALLADRPDDAAQLIEWLGHESAGEALEPQEAALLREARDTLAEHWPAYRALRSRQERRNALTPVVAFRRFVCGWEGEGMPAYAAGPDGLVPLDLMAQLDPLAVQAAGAHAYSLLYAGGSEKNSASPSPSDEGRKTSTSDSRRGAGKSTAKRGSKTRSSRSPRKSSGS